MPCVSFVCDTISEKCQYHSLYMTLDYSWELHVQSTEMWKDHPYALPPTSTQKTTLHNTSNVSVNKGHRSYYWSHLYPFMSFVG